MSNHFSEADLTGAVLDAVMLTGAVFTGALLDGADLSESILNGVSRSRVNHTDTGDEQWTGNRLESSL
jgi:uncharacterized protein YjbI with pentapeptide repeats